MKRDWLLYLVIFSLALNLGTIGTIAYLRYQDQRPQVAGVPPPIPLRALWRELQMDDAQRQAMHRMFPEHRQKVQAYRQELTQKRQELFSLIQEDSASWGAIQSKIQEISALQGALEEEMARFMLEFKKHLKPEQHAAFLKLVEGRLGCPPGGVCGPGGPGNGHRRGPGMGRRGGPPPPPPQ